MINEELKNAFCEQINKELYSEYLYLMMRSRFQEMNLAGFVNWFDVQVQEERAHAMGMVDYISARGESVDFRAIELPKIDGTTPLEIFEQVLEHEQYVTSLINSLADVAERTKDRAALRFLDWYINEQVEEEESVGSVLTTLKLIQDDKHALLMLDKDLATRVFNQPVIR